MAQSFRHLTLDFNSGCDIGFVGSALHGALLWAQSLLEILSLPLPQALPLLTCAHTYTHTHTTTPTLGHRTSFTQRYKEAAHTCAPYLAHQRR